MLDHDYFARQRIGHGALGVGKQSLHKRSTLRRTPPTCPRPGGWSGGAAEPWDLSGSHETSCLANRIIRRHQRPAGRHHRKNRRARLPVAWREGLRENQTRVPHWGQGASPGGNEGSMRKSAPQTGQRLGRPSGVREEITRLVSFRLRGTLAAWPTRCFRLPVIPPWSAAGAVHPADPLGLGRQGPNQDHWPSVGLCNPKG